MLAGDGDPRTDSLSTYLSFPSLDFRVENSLIWLERVIKVNRRLYYLSYSNPKESFDPNKAEKFFNSLRFNTPELDKGVNQMEVPETNDHRLGGFWRDPAH